MQGIGSADSKTKVMKSNNAAVFFVDILGFSALTKGEVTGLKTDDYKAWGLRKKDVKNHSFLAATILLEFRESLKTLKNYLPNLNIAQISDCAFIWSEDITELLIGVHFFMWHTITKRGILCRGGIAYGEIVSVNNDDDELGAFVVGDAVTRAAKNEGRLKGPRITMDVEFPKAVWDNAKNAAIQKYLCTDLFYANHSEVNMDVVDEYRWYLCDAEYVANQKYPPSYKDCVELTKGRLTIANAIMYHPRMGWNTRSKEGMVHMKAGAKSISKNGLLRVLHLFERDEVLDDNRRAGILKRANERVVSDHYFSIDEKEEWAKALDDCD